MRGDPCLVVSGRRCAHASRTFAWTSGGRPERSVPSYSRKNAMFEMQNEYGIR